MGVFLRWDVLHNQADRIADMTMRITSWDTGEEWRRVTASSNPLLLRTGGQHRAHATVAVARRRTKR